MADAALMMQPPLFPEPPPLPLPPPPPWPRATSFSQTLGPSSQQVGSSMDAPRLGLESDLAGEEGVELLVAADLYFPDLDLRPQIHGHGSDERDVDVEPAMLAGAL
ncbi:hypothetical protein TB2_034652 [Malus domestica]